MTEPNPAPPRDEVMAYSEPGHLPTLRAFTLRQAQRAGLAPDRAALLVLAVSELATNTLQHTADGGQVRISAQDDEITCDVIDSGPLPAFGRAMPAADAVRGRGLAIVERLCDQVSAVAGTEGTIVRLRFAIEPQSAAR